MVKDYKDMSWNPVTGCLCKCDYCYVPGMCNRFSGDTRINEGMLDRYTKNGDMYVVDEPFKKENGNTDIYPFGFKPTFHRYKFADLDNIKNGKNIEVSSMGDLFAPWVPQEIIVEVLEECKKHTINNYLFQTKWPFRYFDLTEKGLLPALDNFWYGSTVLTNDDLKEAFRSNAHHCYLVFEPLRENITVNNLNGIEWAVIGPETGRKKTEIGNFDEIVKVFDENGKPVFMRRGMAGYTDDVRKDIPDQLGHHELSAKMKEKLESKCAKCGKHLRKRDMFVIYSMKDKHHENLGHVCEECYQLVKESING